MCIVIYDALVYRRRTRPPTVAVAKNKEAKEAVASI